VWLERINSVLAASTGRAVVPVRAASTLVELPQLERAVTLAGIALAERTPIVLLDQLDAFATDADEHVFFTAVRALAPATTTIVVGVAAAPRTGQDSIELPTVQEAAR
jgi:putative drug exporter of the RND superfamily